jgi:hypothetical protein
MTSVNELRYDYADSLLASSGVQQNGGAAMVEAVRSSVIQMLLFGLMLKNEDAASFHVSVNCRLGFPLILMTFL